MPIGSPLGVTIPVVLVTTGPQYATQISAALQALVDAVEAKVGSAGIEIDADLSAGGYELIDVGAARLASKGSSLTGSTHTRKVYVVSGELYYTDGNGDAIKLTDGGALNAASVAGFTGDYGGADPAAAHFSRANLRYTLFEASGKRADLDVAELLLRQKSVENPNAITIKSPNALASAYALTLPGALPGSTSLLRVTNAGVIQASRDVAIDSVTSAITFSDDVTLGAEIKHGDRTLVLSPAGAATLNASYQYDGDYWGAAQQESRVTIPVPLRVGDRIKTVKYWGRAGSSSAWLASLFRNAFAAGTSTALAEKTSGTSASIEGITSDPLTETVQAGTRYTIVWTGGASGHRFYGAEITYDRP
jgi:hypothetical protein